MTTPPEGAISALMASMSFRNDDQLRMLSDLFNKNHPRGDRLTTIVIECPVQAELNWSLTKVESKRIRASVDKNILDALPSILDYYPGIEKLQRKNQARMEGVKSILQSK